MEQETKRTHFILPSLRNYLCAWFLWYQAWTHWYYCITDVWFSQSCSLRAHLSRLIIYAGKTYFVYFAIINVGILELQPKAICHVKVPLTFDLLTTKTKSLSPSRRVHPHVMKFPPGGPEISPSRERGGQMDGQRGSIMPQAPAVAGAGA